MVVNRKQPTVPQAVSRSASSQNIPTKRQPLTRNAPKRNGVPEIDSRPSTTKAPKHTAKKRRPKTFVDHLFLFTLSLFTFYAFYTCRPNPIFSTPLHTHSVDPNPLCRSLHGYRVHILEPYILPPVKHTLAFTHNLAEPYIAAAQVKADPYIAPIVKGTQTIKPYVIRVIDTGKAIWTRTLVPFYQGILKPYYVKAVLPRYRLYIQPRLAPLAERVSSSYTYYVSRPLHTQAIKLQSVLHRNYHTYVQPYVAQIQPYVAQAYNTIYSVTLQATDIYKTHIHPRVVSAWIQARPVLCTVWKHTKVIILKASEVTAKQLKYAAREIGAYRRTYVDPHVRKIWDKVAEGTETALVPSPVPTPMPPSPLADNLPDTAAEVTESIAQPTSITSAKQSEKIPATSTVEAIVEETTLANPSIPTPEEEAESVVPTGISTPIPEVVAAAEPEVIEEPLTTDTPAAEPTQEATASAESVEQPESKTIQTPAASVEAIKAAESVEAASLVGSTGGEELDLDAFLQDLGVEEAQAIIVDTSAAVAQNQENSDTPAVQEAVPTLTEEERLAKVAEKRNRIVDRHEKWFDQLGELIANETQALVEGLSTWRAEKQAELADMAGKTGKEGKGIIQEVQKEGERLIKGLDGYLKKAAERQSAWKLSPADTKEDREAKTAAANMEKDKWAKVLDKVETKFAEKVRDVQATVHAWFVGAREKEIEDVRDSAIKVKNFAERAQADLGLDYAWLEDVTYADWQSYHDLMRNFEKYEQTAYALQNGTTLPAPAPKPPTDPIIPALNALHQELEDVISGFSVALGPVRSEAARIFSLRPDASDDDDEDSGFFVVRDGEVRKDDLRGVDIGSLGIEKKAGAGVVKGGESEDEEVKILPIGAGPGEAPDPSTIFVGKDKVQVEQALGSIPVEPAAARHEEL